MPPTGRSKGGKSAPSGAKGGGAQSATPKKVVLAKGTKPAPPKPGLAGLKNALSKSFRRLGDVLPPAPPMVRGTSSRLLKRAAHSIKTSDSTESIMETAAAAILEKRESWEGTKHDIGASYEERYFEREVLGEGGFGTVHRVLRNSDGSELACKVIRKMDASHPRAAKEWADAKAEAAMWQTVSSPYHPSILPLLEVIEAEGSCLYLITELMLCGELSDAIFYLEMSEQAARLIAVQLASAIAHLHLRHMAAHRDIKPQNVLCQDADPTAIGCLKLADFGLCRRFPSRAEPCFDEPCGTLDYFSPELATALKAHQDRAKDGSKGGGTASSPAVGDGGAGGAGGPPRFGAAVDVWALGCVVYELLHGHPPYYAPGMDDDTVLGNILRHELPLPEASFGGLSDAGRDFVIQLLEPDASRRPLIEDVLSHAWLQPVQDESLRVQMATAASAEVLERRAARARKQLHKGFLKVVAMNRLSKSERGAPPTSLVRAASTVRSTRDVLALTRAASRRKGEAAPPTPTEADDGDEAEEGVDPMLLYASVYSSSASLGEMEA